MSYAGRLLRAGVRKVLLAQLVLFVTVAAAAYVAVSAAAALAVAYGGMTAAVLTGLHGLSADRMAPTADQSTGRGLAILYFGLFQRFIVALALFAVGMGPLQLEPAGILVGFAVAQLAYLVNLRTHLGAEG